MKLKTITAVAASATLGMSAANAAIIVDAFAGTLGETDSSQTLALAGDSSDIIVVLVSGEHGFNNTSGQANGVNYNGIAMTEIVNRDPIASTTNTSYASMFILTSPAVGDGSGVITNVTNRGIVSAYALSGTSGVAQSGFTTSGTVGVTANTTAGNLVIAGVVVGGHNNNGNTSAITADGPLSLDGKADVGPQWSGHAVGSATVGTTGSNTYSFSGAEDENAGGFADDNHFVVWAEFEQTVIPEPSTTALLGLGGLALILRRRK